MKHETLSSILARIEPYDKNSHSKEGFLKELNSHHDLKQLLEKELVENEEWLERSKTVVCFILNDNRWKHPHSKHHKSNVRLSFVGREGIPTISLDLD